MTQLERLLKKVGETYTEARDVYLEGLRIVFPDQYTFLVYLLKKAAGLIVFLMVLQLLLGR